jgi:hypothetical protein
MKINEYFENTAGTGVFSTSDDHGEVNSAVYAKPHVLDSNTVQFIMRDRLSRANLKKNVQACYLYIEKGTGYSGVRLYLSMVNEEQDEEKIKAMSRRPSRIGDENGDRFLVTFKVEKVLTLIGGNEIELE